MARRQKRHAAAAGQGQSPHFLRRDYHHGLGGGAQTAGGDGDGDGDGDPTLGIENLVLPRRIPDALKRDYVRKRARGGGGGAAAAVGAAAGADGDADDDHQPPKRHTDEFSPPHLLGAGGDAYYTTSSTRRICSARVVTPITQRSVGRT